jgi:murein DD-endopeptidase MepM/ murein hydrolase activator NlpD
LSGNHHVWARIVLLAWGLVVVSGCGKDLEANTSPTLPPSPTEDQLATLIAQQRPTDAPTFTATVTETTTSTASHTPELTPTLAPTETPVPTDTPAPTSTDTEEPAVSPAEPRESTATPAAIARVEPDEQAQSTTAATVTPTPTQVIPTIPPTNTRPPSPTPITPTPTLIPTNTPRPTQPLPANTTAVAGTEFDATGELRDHYWFARPFPRDPSNEIHDFASRNYAYGSTAGGGLQTHHGLDFQNLLGTSILAVASGTVFYAGNDLKTLFGPRNDFYGNLVVIEHDMPAPNGEPLYTLYGHMFRVEVKTGQRVELNERLGSVGSTGAALGSHLHLEVRIGDPYDYASSYNPDLWLRPWGGYGTLAGRIWDRDGERMYGTNIIIQSVNGPDRYTYSYADDLVNPDSYYGEHFTCGDLPAGTYQVLVRIRGVLRYKGEVTIESGKTSWLEINVN